MPHIFSKGLKIVPSIITVLYIDDTETFNKPLGVYLDETFTHLTLVHSAQEGLRLWEKNAFDLIVIDFDIPHINGLELSQIIKNKNPHQNIIMVSTYTEKEILIQSMHIGVDGYVTKPFEQKQASMVFSKLCEKIEHIKANEHYKNHLEDEVKRQVDKIRKLEKEQEQAYKAFLFGLVNLLEERDTYTGGHSMRVAQYAKAIAKQLGFSVEVCEQVFEAGMLHDIGKTVIPDSILLKPDRFNELEYEIIKQHVNMAKSILTELPMFKSLIPIIQSHHERIDGSGYPLGLIESDIPIEAQIISIADCFDAMTTRRIYKNHTMTPKEALDEIQQLSGMHFTEEVTLAALNYFQSISLEQTHDQRPKNLLEYERFSFFFKDQLTKLYNQNFLDYLHLFQEEPYAFSSCLCIDKFYKYNDTYGWKEGDRLLVDIAKYLQTLFPTTYTKLFRTKGDIFVILSHEKIELNHESLHAFIPVKSPITFLRPLHNASLQELLDYLTL